MLILGAHISFSSIFCFHSFEYLHLKLRVEQIRNWPQASMNCSLLKKKQNRSMKSQEIQRWGSTKVYWAEARRASDFPEIPTGVMTQQSVAISCRKEQSNSWNAESARSRVISAVAKFQCPMGMSCNICSVEKWGCKPGVIAMTCEEQDL